jgi:hypothetical protein
MIADGVQHAIASPVRISMAARLIVQPPGKPERTGTVEIYRSCVDFVEERLLERQFRASQVR